MIWLNKIPNKEMSTVRVANGKARGLLLLVTAIGLILSGCSGSASGSDELVAKDRPDSVGKDIWYKGKEYLDAYMKADDEYGYIDDGLSMELMKFTSKYEKAAVLGVSANLTKQEKEIVTSVYWMNSQYNKYLAGKDKDKSLKLYEKQRDKLIKIYYK